MSQPKIGLRLSVEAHVHPSWTSHIPLFVDKRASEERDQIDENNNHENQYQQCKDLVVLQKFEVVVDVVANTTCSHNADHRSVAYVVLKHENELTEKVVAVLGNHDVFGDARAREPHGPSCFQGTAVHAFERLVLQLSKVSNCVEGHGQHARKRTKTDDNHENNRPDQTWKASNSRQQQPDGYGNPNGLEISCCHGRKQDGPYKPKDA